MTTLRIGIKGESLNPISANVDQKNISFFPATPLKMGDKLSIVGLLRMRPRVSLEEPNMRGDRVKSTTLRASAGSAAPSNTQLCLFAVN